MVNTILSFVDDQEAWLQSLLGLIVAFFRYAAEVSLGAKMCDFY